MGDIADFARKQFMSARAMRALQQIFEECCVLTLMARGGAVYPVRFSIFSGGSEGDCTVEIRYAGESYDPFAEAEFVQEGAQQYVKASEGEEEPDDTGDYGGDSGGEERHG